MSKLPKLPSPHKFLDNFAEKRAMRDPEYAAFENRKKKSNLFHEGDLEEFFEHIKHFEELNPWWSAYSKWHWRVRSIPGLPKEIKWFVQRGRRGYADCDVWNLNNYLAKIIVGGAEQLRDIAHGFPAEEDMTYEQWQRELTMIAEGFRLYLENDDFVPDETWDKFKHRFLNLWD